MPRSLASIVLLAALAASCVINRSTRSSLPESAQGPTTTPVTGSPVLANTSPADEDTQPAPAKPGATWVRGYWHWDGVRYVWEHGRWESPAAPATNEVTRPTPNQ